MSVATTWTTSAYQRIVSARLEGASLVVRFEDGAHSTVEARRLLPAGTVSPSWSRMKVGAYELVVPTSDGEAIISWTNIRAASDSAYSEHLARVTEEQARAVGRRLRSLREASGITIDMLAERACLDAMTAADIEDGRRTAPLATVRRLVESLGGSLRDLADPV